MTEKQTTDETIGHQHPYDKIGPALVKAISEIPTIPKHAKAYGYNYATLDDILTIVKPILSKHKLAVIQPLCGDGLETILMHSSGQCIREVVALPEMGENKKMNAAQAVGATITYMRRYALSSMLCISTDEDSDGSVGHKATHTPVEQEQGGTFKGFSTAAKIQEDEHKPQPTFAEIAVAAEIADAQEADIADATQEAKMDKLDLEEAVILEEPPNTIKASPLPEINWDEAYRKENNLCSSKQQAFIFTLAQRNWGSEFEMEDITGFTDIGADKFVGLTKDVFCGNLSKKDASRVINTLGELAGIET